jgi:hypothetical protein
MAKTTDHQPTEAEAWSEFFERASTVLAELFKGGWSPEQSAEQPAAAAA